MRKLLRTIKRVLDKTFGTIIDEFYWSRRHLFNQNWARDYISESNLSHPHRQLLIERISAYAPFETALEIGCASGPNLYLLAGKFPEANFYGTDISAKAVAIGKEWLKSRKIKNIFLSRAKGEDLKNFADKSIDIVFTDATLIYFGPDRIEKVIKAMLKVAKKAIIFVEQHANSPKSLYDDHWIHNYKSLLKKFVPEEKIKFTKIPQELWGGDWAKYGYIIEVKLI